MKTVTVREIMTTDIETCTPQDSCADALAIMQRRNCGFVPVVEGQGSSKLIGVATDRDIALHLLDADCAASDTLMEECMTREVKTISPDARVEEAIKLLESAAVHRLPVIEGDKLMGVLSLKDIALFMAGKHERAAKEEAPAAGDRQIGEMIESIAAAR